MAMLRTVATAVISLTVAASLVQAQQQRQQQQQQGLAYNFRGSAQVTQDDVKLALEEELSSAGRVHVDGHVEALREMFQSLPKDDQGHVGHQAVRYGLHRYFVQRHGWFIRGLEPGNATWTPERLANGELPPTFVKEWVPNDLQAKLEARVGGSGLELRDMAAMAAALEDLIHKEVDNRLRMVYDAHDQKSGESETLSYEKAEDVLSTYLMTFLLGNNLTARSKDELFKKKKLFAKRYREYNAVHDWYEKNVQDHLPRPSTTGAGGIGFGEVAKVVHRLGEEFHSFNEVECEDLRKTLAQVESRKQGRVRLSTFYNMSRFTHWRFTEKAAYLKSLGALDDSDERQPHVLIANYVMARPNCLEASNLYAICCRNPCEDLMTQLERTIGAPAAKPERIRSLVESMGSASVQAPRNLPAGLASRLDEIAAQHGGEVPLHGRLFAQWMHHAYPRECPFPHEAGAINPQTASEWLRESGHSSEQSSEEEMRKHVEADVCAVNWQGKVECEQESSELPWNPAEELLTGATTAAGAELRAPATIAGGRMKMLGVAAEDDDEDLSVASWAGFVTCLLFAASVLRSMMKKRGRSGEDDTKALGIIAVLGFAGAAYFVGVLDGQMFSLTALGGLVVCAVSLASARRASRSMKGKKDGLPMHTKVCV